MRVQRGCEQVAWILNSSLCDKSQKHFVRPAATGVAEHGPVSRQAGCRRIGVTGAAIISVFALSEFLHFRLTSIFAYIGLQ
jgi:hypothetical protein